jgi:predicted lipid-binding transport protein (Tim44 family)
LGDDLSILETLAFAIVAVVLFVRLRSVLGKRTGNERPRNFQPFQPSGPATQSRQAGEVVSLPPRPGLFRPETGSIDPAAQPLGTGIERIKSVDPQFDEEAFLGGARVAFEMIVDSYARGDVATLKPLLAPPVYENFAGAIGNRETAGEQLETRIEAVRKVELIEASLNGSTALVTVKFTTEQINVTRDRDGHVLDGAPDEPHEVIDIWVFGRDTRSNDPNWQLVATRTPS